MKETKPIPPEATMVFKGTIFEVWQWEQELFDGSMMTFERLRRPDTAVIVPVMGDSIVIVDEEQPDSGQFVTAPSGRIEKDEEPLVGAKRELKEETGLESDDWEPLLTVRPASKIDWTVYVYVARNCIKTAEQQLDAGERITVRKVSFDEFLALSENPKFRSGELTDLMLRARLDPEKKEALRKQLFKS